MLRHIRQALALPSWFRLCIFLSQFYSCLFTTLSVLSSKTTPFHNFMIFMIFSHAFMSTFSPEAEGFKFLTFSKLVRASIGSMDALFNSLRVQLCLWNLCGLGVYLSGLVAAVFFFFFFLCFFLFCACVVGSWLCSAFSEWNSHGCV